MSSFTSSFTASTTEHLPKCKLARGFTIWLASFWRQVHRFGPWSKSSTSSNWSVPLSISRLSTSKPRPPARAADGFDFQRCYAIRQASNKTWLLLQIPQAEPNDLGHWKVCRRRTPALHRASKPFRVDKSVFGLPSLDGFCVLMMLRQCLHC